MIKLEYENLNTIEIVLCEGLTPVSTQYTCFYYYIGGDYRDCCLPESDAV